MRMFKEDLKRNGLKKAPAKAWLTGHSIIAVLNYRIANYLYRHNIALLPHIISYKNVRRFGCEISPYAKISGGLFMPHTLGIVIGHSVTIGKKLRNISTCYNWK